MSHKCSFSKDSILSQNVVITFRIKQEFVADIASSVKVFLDHKSHVTKGQVDEIPHENEIVIFAINSVSISKTELRCVKVLDTHLVTFEFTCLCTVDNVIIFCEVLVSPSVLEEHSIFLYIEAFDLFILLQIPKYNTVHLWRLCYSNSNSVFVTSSPNLNDECLSFSFINI